MFNGHNLPGGGSWRQQELKALLRYDGFEEMRYRSSVFLHTRRVHAMVKRVNPIAEEVFYLAQAPFEGDLALAIAECHDDPEIITKDVSVIKKDHMTPAERRDHERKTLAAIETLSQQLPDMFMGYKYKRLLMHAHRKDCLEAQLVKWLDWMDAICEIKHELFAGNLLFIRGIIRSSAATGDLKKTYPDLVPLLERGDSAFLQVAFEKHHLPHVKKAPYAHLGKPHTRQSIELETDFPLYDAWKKMVVNDLGEEGINSLITQVEGVALPEPDVEVRPKLALVM